jgi:hypothetical protein
MKNIDLRIHEILANDQKTVTQRTSDCIEEILNEDGIVIDSVAGDCLVIVQEWLNNFPALPFI